MPMNGMCRTASRLHCDAVCIEPESTSDPVERRWQFIQHALFMCERDADRGPTRHMLFADLFDIAHVADEHALQERVQACMNVPADDWRAVRRELVPLLLDPAEMCAEAGAARAVAAQVQAVCAACILGVGTVVSRQIMCDYAACARGLPAGSRIAAALTSMLPVGPASEPDSDCEVWVDEDEVSASSTAPLAPRGCRAPAPLPAPRGDPPGPPRAGAAHSQPLPCPPPVRDATPPQSRCDKRRLDAVAVEESDGESDDELLLSVRLQPSLGRSGTHGASKRACYASVARLERQAVAGGVQCGSAVGARAGLVGATKRQRPPVDARAGAGSEDEAAPLTQSQRAGDVGGRASKRVCSSAGAQAACVASPPLTSVPRPSGRRGQCPPG